jgi:hypothetical protein
MNLKDPQTDAEWQEAVNVAAALLLIDSGKQYGLIQGGPAINVERCDLLLRQGAKRGIRPNKPIGDMAITLLRQINAGIDKTNAKDPAAN